MSLAAAAAKLDPSPVAKKGGGAHVSLADIMTSTTKTNSSLSRLKAAAISTAAVAKISRSARGRANVPQHDSVRAMLDVQKHLPPQSLLSLNNFCDRVRSVR